MERNLKRICKKKLTMTKVVQSSEIYKNQSLEDLQNEVWKDIIGWEGYYQISNLGRVKSIERYFLAKGTPVKVELRILVQIKNVPHDGGYFRVLLCRDGKRSHIMVHRLVAECFIENPNNEKLVNHMDCNKLNNHYSNLEWVSYQGNRTHAIKNNCIKFAKGTSHGHAKLTEADVYRIRELLNFGSIMKPIAIRFNISISTVHNIKIRKIWAHLPIKTQDSGLNSPSKICVGATGETGES